MPGRGFQSDGGGRALAVVRSALAGIFLWAFADKLLGLGFSTPAANAWTAGGSPTTGYLKGLKGWLADSFHPLAGQGWVDWAFMLGLLLLGLALALGVALRAAAVGGVALMLLLWLTSLPIRSNPVIDQHVIYAAVLVALAATDAGRIWGLARTARRALAGAPAPVRAALG
jgi:thiosulfate dehydrogenase [quinone] large subunit